MCFCFISGYPGICCDKSSKLGYPRLCWDIPSFVSVYRHTAITQDTLAARWVQVLQRLRSQPSRLPPCLQQCLFPAHQALAYCRLETCPRESLLRAACHTGVETRLGPPGHSQSMHTKHETICTCLPEAMLISSTALTMTRMAPSQTSLLGIRAHVGAVQLVETTS